MNQVILWSSLVYYCPQALTVKGPGQAGVGAGVPGPGHSLSSHIPPWGSLPPDPPPFFAIWPHMPASALLVGLDVNEVQFGSSSVSGFFHLSPCWKIGVICTRMGVFCCVIYFCLLWSVEIGFCFFQFFAIIISSAFKILLAPLFV